MGVGQRGTRHDLWRLLRGNRDFRRLYAAQLVSFGGDWFLIVALSGLVLRLTGSATYVTAIFVAYNVPFAFGALWGGRLADRADRKRVMIVANVARGVLALGFLFVDTRSDLWLAYALAATLSAISSFFMPAASATVPNIVDERDLGAANVLAGSAWGTMLAVGAGIGGIVVAEFGTDSAYVVDAATFFVGAALILGIRTPTTRSTDERRGDGMLAGTREGLAYVRAHPDVLVLLSTRFGVGLAVGVVALLPVMAIDLLDAGDRGTGWLFAFRGAGAVLGPFAFRHLTAEFDRRATVPALLVLPVVFTAFYAISPWMPGILAAGAAVFLAHLAGGAHWMLSTYAYQSIVPDRVLGRVFGVDGSIVTSTMAISNLSSGWLASTVGVRSALGLIAGLVTLVMLLTVLLHHGRTRSAVRQTQAVGPEGPPPAAEHPGTPGSAPQV